MRFRVSLVFAAAGLAALTYAALDAFTIKYEPKVGDLHKYRQVGKFDVGGQEFNFEAVVAEKVTKVETTGSFVQEESTTDVKLDGQDPPGGGGGGKFTISYSPKREVVEIKGDGVDGKTYRFENLALLILPDMPVNVGDSWNYEVKPDAKLGTVAAKATYTLVGEDKVGTKDALKIKFTIKETSDDQSSSSGTVWLAKDDCAMLKLATKWTNAPVPGSPVLISGDITLTLIP